MPRNVDAHQPQCAARSHAGNMAAVVVHAETVWGFRHITDHMRDDLEAALFSLSEEELDRLETVEG